MEIHPFFGVILLIYVTLTHSASVLIKKTASDEEFIRCVYVGGSDDANYECIMSINNPNGREFDQVEGDHLSGLSNEDVTHVNLYSGTSKIVPSIICTQFPNAIHLTIMGINVEELTPTAFNDCHNLNEAFIIFNDITSIPANTFANSPNLELLEISRNKIAQLNENSFNGTAISFLAIDYNELSTFNQAWFTSINGTLSHLELVQNQIQELGPDSFNNLRELTELILNYNPLGSSISPTAFDGLNKLQIFSLSRTAIPFINPTWFRTLETLTDFYAQNNQIAALENDTFSSLRNLRRVFLTGNQIRVISLAAFGASARNLHTLYVGDNRVNNIDPYWLYEVGDVGSLEYLLLSGNLCIDEDFLNLGSNMWRVTEALQSCIDNFMLPPMIQCNYEFTGLYICNLIVHNPNGIEFETIGGEHLDGRGNADVTTVGGNFANSQIFPSILCSEFVNLRSVMLSSGNLEELNANDFQNCRNIEQLSFHFNKIRTIEDFTFRNSPNLQFIDVGGNELSNLGDNTFDGTQLSFIALDINRITSFDQRWFESINSTLNTLDLWRNEIVSLDSDAFSNLRNLRSLVIGGNPLWNIERTAFSSLENLLLLDLSNTLISVLNPAWFQNLHSLERINLQSNDITDIPSGTFASNSNLRSLSIWENRIRSLSADAFGDLSNLTDILASFNVLRAFDPRILEKATSLTWLWLFGNICTNENFADVSNNLTEVRNSLSMCISHFGPERIACRYYQPGSQYVCSLDIFNPLGRDDFEDVEGEHMEGRDDNDVQLMYINDGVTVNVPTVLCRKFQNLISMDFIHDEIEDVDVNAFSNCQNLERIYIYDNLIETLPNGLFRNNPMLKEVSLGHNRLTRAGIPANIFAGTSLTFLDLSDNPIIDFNSAWTLPVASTLRQLELFNIQATHLPVLFFNLPSVLETLEVGNNPLREIIPAVFDRLTTLRNLDLGNCMFRRIDPDWFRELRELRSLRISGNQILDLPPDVFSTLENLSVLYIYNNKLRELNADWFGNSLPSIDFIYAQQNEIYGIDPRLLPGATNLNALYLADNQCSQENFYNVSGNPDIVAENISRCINNFNADSISCNYVRNAQGSVTCVLRAYDPFGRNRFENIEGEHLAGTTNDDVQVVEIINQNSRSIPHIICQQFRNLRALVIHQSHVDVFAQRNLNECTNLEILMIYRNELYELLNYSFQNNKNLEYLELGFNRIQRIEEFAFSGASINFLDLAGNNLGIFNPRWFEPINSTLEFLDLLDIGLWSLPQNAFRNIRNLKTLVLSRNPLWHLTPNIFDGLDVLEELYLSNCDIFSLDSSPFRSLGNLRSLYLQNNQIEWLSLNPFNSLRSLTTINLSNNSLWSINSEHFGNSLNSLEMINLSNNVFNVFERTIITEASNLRTLLMDGNVCVSRNFFNVNDNVNEVLEGISRCIHNSVVEPSINCTYSLADSNQYMCTLSVINPRGDGMFSNISGDHVDEFTDNDVTVIFAYNQDTRNLPFAICNQFRNLEDVTVYRSNLEQLQMTMFRNCARLRVVVLNGGFIRAIPPLWLHGNILLEYVSLADNRIFMIQDNSFFGSPLHTLDLGHNRLDRIIPQVINPIAETLRLLDLNNNQIRGFPIDTFENLESLEELHLDQNPLTELFDESFLTLSNLRVLSMNNCQLRRLNPMMFYEMINVQTLRLNNNQLEFLPDGAFHNMTSLEVLEIVNNRIGFLNATQFGGAMQSIRIINAPGNRINALDRNLIQHTSNLNSILLAGNVCIDESFNYVQENLQSVLESLNICFDNFDLEPIIECEFSELDEYFCDARIHNPIDEDFSSIAGQHQPDKSDEDVQLITITNQNTKTFPRVICRQFNNLRNILMLRSNLEIVEAFAFENCIELRSVYINDNRITEVPANLFSNSPNLQFLSLYNNRIRRIHPNAFAGTSIDFLDLGINQLSNIDHAWFIPINNTLKFLDLYDNSITRLENRAFGTLMQLEVLIIGSNRFEINTNPFDGVDNLKSLGLHRCGIRELQSSWFSVFSNLEILDLEYNGISDLPNGIFNNLTSLRQLVLQDNLLTTVRATSFGASLENLESLNLVHNIISSIDPQLLNDSTNLNYFFLSGNICINENFYDVSNEIETVRERLALCFDSFN